MENLFSKRSTWVVILILIAFSSMFVFSKVASSPEFHESTIEVLDEKKLTVMELTAATATASTVIAALPGDATSPLANQMVGLSEYLLIIIGVIFFEKMLLTLTGYVTFSFLIPIACLLFAIYLFAKIDVLKQLAIKLIIFGIVIFMVVPVSVKVSDLIEATYETNINQTIEDTKNFDTEIEENVDDNVDESFWDGLLSKTKDTISNIGNSVSTIVDKCEKLLSNFIDAIAVLLITSCVIPIVVLLFMVWIIKMVFGINIPINKIKLPAIKKKDTKQEITKE